MWKRIILLAIFYSGLIGMLAMAKPYMVDLGFDIKEIGFIGLVLRLVNQATWAYQKSQNDSRIQSIGTNFFPRL